MIRPLDQALAMTDISVLKIHDKFSTDVREYKQSQNMCRYRIHFGWFSIMTLLSKKEMTYLGYTVPTCSELCLYGTLYFKTSNPELVFADYHALI